MLIRYPRPLHNKSTVGLICPAGGFEDYKPIVLASRYLKKLGYKVKLGDSLVNSKKSYKYLSGDDESRVADLLDFWFDKSVDAVFCLKGGFGSLRLIDKIDFAALKRVKKIFIGFSDVTVLLLAIYSKTNLITFHGPMLGADFLNNKVVPKDGSSATKMFRLLHDQKFNFSYSTKNEGIVIYPGVAKGHLIGGNLTSICSMIGTNYLPDFKGSILFLEDINEEPYTIDRMITQFSLAGLLKKVSGIIFASFHNSGFRSRRQVARLLRDKVSDYKIPVVYYFPSGHGSKNHTLPIGRKVLLDADRLVLKAVD